MVNRNYQIRGCASDIYIFLCIYIYMIYFEPESPNEGGLFNTYHEPLSPNEGACLTCMLSRYRQLRGARSRYRMTRNYQIRGRALDIWQRRSSDIWFKIPNEGGVFIV